LAYPMLATGGRDALDQERALSLLNGLVVAQDETGRLQRRLRKLADSDPA